MTAQIHACTCKHVYQDSKYGVGKRVMNPCKKGAKIRCTVCNAEYDVKPEK